MKLVKIFSDGPFKNVCFNEGYNIVLATVHDKENKKDTHNLGKTSLLYVIDFLLLSNYSKSYPILSNPIFQDQNFFLEILLNSGLYLIIRRNTKNPSKVSFKQNTAPLPDYTAPEQWDDDNISFDNAKEKLNNYLGYDILPKWSYRKSISYFLRGQKDFTDVFQLNKFAGKHIHWKPFVFDLLGFDGNLIKNKLQCDDDIEKKKTEIETLQNKAQIDISEKDKIAGLIDIKNGEKITAEQEIDKFNFYNKDKDVNRDIINNLDTRLQCLNADRYRIGHEIKKISSSLEEASSNIRLEKLKELFNEVELFFPETLSKKYEELERFTDSISTERRKFLEENLTFLSSEYNKINEEIQKLQKERSEKVILLTEVDVYSKFKIYQKELASLEGELSFLNEKLGLINKIIDIQTELDNLKNDRKNHIKSIQESINQRSHAKINKIFNEIIKKVTDTNALISIKQNADGNVDFQADYLKDTQTTTSEGDGTSYKKLLCVSFDIAILIYYTSHSFYRFVYHDGVLEGLDDRVKQRLIEVTKEISSKYGIQYILSLIDSDIPNSTTDSIFTFPMDAVCLNLNDENDSGKLFQRSF